MLGERVDSFVRMQLLDLARTLTRNSKLEVDTAYHSVYLRKENKITVSQFWRDLKKADQVAGMKSDVYLRALGSAWLTDGQILPELLEDIEQSALPRLAKQLFALAEDIRLEQACLQVRPGTVRVFKERTRLYGRHFQLKFTSHLHLDEEAEALFCLIYLWLKGFTPDSEPSPQLEDMLRIVQPVLERWEEAESTEEAAKLVLDMVDLLSFRLPRDAKAVYFTVEADSGADSPVDVTFLEELKRHKGLANEEKSGLGPEHEQKETEQAERMETWHRETQDTDPGMLRFELERGTRTEALGGVLRESDSADQALSIVQGRSSSSNRRSELPSGEEVPRLVQGGFAPKEETGRINSLATVEYLPVHRPSSSEQEKYRIMEQRVSSYVSKLKKTIQLVMEQKKTSPRSERLFGRLSKNLVRAVTDPNPRLFYKKANPASQIDAAFTLLVDCSASMYDKMEETQYGLILVHEALLSLRIPHEIIGFWEDADRVTDKEVPNVFHAALDFTTSLSPRSGPTLLQLEPQQDNRDGFAIRHMTARLLRRPEQQRILLVFTDGEPSASDYHEEGILDTYQAVQEARRQSIEVIGVFLASGEVHETQRNTLTNIYGRQSVVVPHVEQLADYLTPLIRRLLLKAIQ